MSLPRPTDPTTPPDPLGSRRDIHLTGLSGVLTLIVLLVLSETTFEHNSMPADIVQLLSPAMSYAVSVATGYVTRWRLVRASPPPVAVPPVPEPPETPAAPQAPA